ncbi:hypothetical protein QNI19_03990 [Cytophagaceae bacterium DM2B3-1]|uniref:DUF3244 domain-containing protein n=1 Tax=Xanthocytophaga flava TaxID=3048013 RepID=A0AAE3QQU6_9BACT|nr:hypothetical protein [Xanthocytophaga flavus]MDJ1468904.1 hypothetical protein [Xanthocytophaga flavus]MDJ1481820.1 hypothetical protein [Xanthocytophaga flavus]MDJ1492078.1 hypothetical protein [Xanthocytophaga flavus]
MKKVLFTLAASVLFTTIVSANNNPKSPVSMAAYKTADAEGVKLVVVNSTAENVTVKIKDANGRVIFTDVIRNEEKFTRKYVFAPELHNSDYTIEVTNSQGAASQSVTL